MPLESAHAAMCRCSDPKVLTTPKSNSASASRQHVQQSRCNANIQLDAMPTFKMEHFRTACLSQVCQLQGCTEPCSLSTDKIVRQQEAILPPIEASWCDRLQIARSRSLRRDWPSAGAGSAFLPCGLGPEHTRVEIQHRTKLMASTKTGSAWPSAWLGRVAEAACSGSISAGGRCMLQQVERTPSSLLSCSSESSASSGSTVLPQKGPVPSASTHHAAHHALCWGVLLLHWCLYNRLRSAGPQAGFGGCAAVTLESEGKLKESVLLT
jgi:hypothetical protein